MFDLIFTERQKRIALANGAVGVAILTPIDFLRLTTTTKDDIARIQSTAHSIKQYNEWSEAGEILAAPYLDVDVRGRVLNHEGRHRAAAMMAIDSGQYAVVIYPRPRNAFTLANMPSVLIGQFASRVRVVINGVYSLKEDE